MAAELELRGVSKSYGQFPALEDVSFSCARGEFFTLFGPSGAGKTTALELIAGIKGGHSGEIALRGRPLANVPIQERDVAMAFEQYALYPHLSVAENIAFPLRSPAARRMPEADILRKVRWTAEELDIAHLLDRSPAQLSGGQRQRVSLARALAREAAVYLLDEPLAHLDAKLRTVARTNLKALARDLGATIVYVTHDYREALGLSDRLLILHEGRVLQIGTPREIYHQPANDFVGRLLGEPAINLLDGSLEDADGAAALIAGGTRIELPGKLADEARARISSGTREARLGIRPAGVAVSSAPAPGAIELDVYTVEHGPDQALVYFAIAGQLFGGYAPAADRFEAGGRAWVRLASGRGHLFDATFELPAA